MSILTLTLLNIFAALVFTMMVTILEEEILYMIGVCNNITGKVFFVIGWIMGKESAFTFNNQEWVYRWFKRIQNK